MKADIKEYNLAPEVLEMLLKDRTTQHNILWGCDDYAYPASSQIESFQISNGDTIIPRFEKEKHISNGRRKSKGEVFTPMAIVKKQNDIAERQFNSSWIDYVKKKVLEATCGEAPYLVNRYDVVTGEIMLLRERQGLLDRKLMEVSTYTSDEQEWKQYAILALKATYGFELQGDSLLIARENIFETWKDYFYQKFPNGKITFNEEILVADIISFNLFQMDGISCCIPYSKIPVKVMNWETKEMEIFNPKLNIQPSLFQYI